jgi:glutathione S-transferase
MQLYTTPTSPYGRAIRLVILEKGLAGRIELVVAQTREPGSPYYGVNPSGRVPFLVRDDGVGIEDSQLIALYLDSLDGKPRLTPQLSHQDWAYGRLETYARSMLDGISVYLREMRRPETERSPTILSHEADRALRLADFWEHEIGHPLMQGPLNMAQLLLIVGLDTGAACRIGDLEGGRPKLSVWTRRLRALPSVKATAAA